MITYDHESGKLEATNHRLVQVSKMSSKLHHSNQGILTISPYCEVTVDESIDGLDIRYKCWLYTHQLFVALLVNLEMVS